MLIINKPPSVLRVEATTVTSSTFLPEAMADAEADDKVRNPAVAEID